MMRRVLLWAAVPVAMLMVQVAAMPVGVLWGHDGKGYDALEYHLQGPKEYIAKESVAPLKHNVFSYLPQNTEMLFALAMLLEDDPTEGMVVSAWVNVLIAAAFVAAVWALTRGKQTAVRMLTVAVAISCQLIFAAGSFYSEPLMLLAVLAAMACWTEMTPVRGVYGRAAVSGALLGVAIGCKYTAVLLAAPVVIAAVLVGAHAATEHRGRAVVLLLGTTVVMMTPWLVRTGYYAKGNVVFPMAARWLGKAHWSQGQVDRWDRAIAPAAEYQSVSGRCKRLAWVLGDVRQYGIMTAAVVLALIVGNTAKRRQWGFYGLAMLWMIAAWVLWTHLQGRFFYWFWCRRLGRLGRQWAMLH